MLEKEQTEFLLKRGFSRRHLGRIATLITAGAALPFYNEFAMAQQADRAIGRDPEADPEPAVRISSNENPMGPCAEGLAALKEIAPRGWRYSPGNPNDAFTKAVAAIEGVPENHISLFAGSSDPLHRSRCAFTSPTMSWTMGDPGYGRGAPEFIGSKLVSVPLKADYSHDVEAMLKADPKAGVYYITNPNNPTGTVTPRESIKYLLAHKSPETVVVVDEAYIHYSPNTEPCSDLVAAGEDIVVLRTFSKIYGMAGLRAGFAMARPDLLERMSPYGSGRVPVTAAACATASLKVKNLISERRKINAGVREDTFAFLKSKGVPTIPSETNFFMMEVGRPGNEFRQAMSDQGVVIGRVWDAYPTMVRVTVGTAEEMSKFQKAFEKVAA